MRLRRPNGSVPNRLRVVITAEPGTVEHHEGLPEKYLAIGCRGRSREQVKNYLLYQVNKKLYELFDDIDYIEGVHPSCATSKNPSPSQ